MSKPKHAIEKALKLLEHGGILACMLITVYKEGERTVINPFIVAKDRHHLKGIHNAMVEGIEMLDNEIGDPPEISPEMRSTEDAIEAFSGFEKCFEEVAAAYLEANPHKTKGNTSAIELMEWAKSDFQSSVKRHVN